MTLEEIDILLNLKDEIITLEFRINYLKQAHEIEMRLWDSNDEQFKTLDRSLNELDAIIQRDEAILDKLKNKLSKYELRNGDKLND